MTSGRVMEFGVVSGESAADKKARQMADGERVMANALAGVEGLFRRLNLSPQPLSVQVYPDKPHPTRSHLLPFGPTATPPAEALHVGRILREIVAPDQLAFFLRNAALQTEGHGPRTEARTFMPAYSYFLGIATPQALGDDVPAQARGGWAAIVLGCASLLRWTGGHIRLGEDPLRDARWRTLFDDEVATFAEHLADGAIQVGSERLALMMSGLAVRTGCRSPSRRATQDQGAITPVKVPPGTTWSQISVRVEGAVIHAKVLNGKRIEITPEVLGLVDRRKPGRPPSDAWRFLVTAIEAKRTGKRPRQEGLVSRGSQLERRAKASGGASQLATKARKGLRGLFPQILGDPLPRERGQGWVPAFSIKP